MKKTVLTSFTILYLLSAVFFMGLTLHIQPVKAGGAVYIKADGSIDPPTAPISTVDNITYTFTDNIHDSIAIERNNTVIDGAGYTLEGTGSGNGIDLSERSNVTIKNMEIKSFENGVWLSFSFNNNISSNTIDANYEGIYLYWSDYNSICHNNITDSGSSGIFLNGPSDYNNISHNDIINSVDGIYLQLYARYNNISQNTIADCSWSGIGLGNAKHNSISANTAKGNYLGISLSERSDNNSISRNNITASNRYGVSLSDSANNSISGNNITDNFNGVHLYESSSNSISGNNVTANNNHGIYLEDSANSSISGNNITACNGRAVYLFGSSSNNISGNNVIDNYWDGVSLSGSSNNSISGNNIANNDYAVKLSNSSDNSISGNNITDSFNGVYLYKSSSNSISGNNITANSLHGVALSTWSDDNNISGNNIANHGFYAVELLSSSGNTFHHNNFVHNDRLVYAQASYANVWDYGYPSGGNYWSEYNGTDSDHDGIGDTPHIIDENNEDSYPLLGMLSDFNVTSEYYVQTVCNSTISGFHINDTAVYFDVTGEDGTTGFCRISIPMALLNGSYKVYVGDIEVPYTLLLYSDMRAYLYFQYNHSTQEVVITTEYYELLSKYLQLLEDFESVNSTYLELLDDYGFLQGNYASLNSTYNNLLTYYGQLQSDYDATINELNNIRNLMYLFIATTAILIATTVYFVIRKPKVKP